MVIKATFNNISVI